MAPWRARAHEADSAQGRAKNLPETLTARCRTVNFLKTRGEIIYDAAIPV